MANRSLIPGASHQDLFIHTACQRLSLISRQPRPGPPCSRGSHKTVHDSAANPFWTMTPRCIKSRKSRLLGCWRTQSPIDTKHFDAGQRRNLTVANAAFPESKSHRPLLKPLPKSMVLRQLLESASPGRDRGDAIRFAKTELPLPSNTLHCIQPLRAESLPLSVIQALVYGSPIIGAKEAIWNELAKSDNAEMDTPSGTKED